MPKRAATDEASIKRSCSSCPVRPQISSRPTPASSKSPNGIPRNGNAPPGRKCIAITGSSAAISEMYDPLCGPTMTAGGTFNRVWPSAA